MGRSGSTANKASSAKPASARTLLACFLWATSHRGRAVLKGWTAGHVVMRDHDHPNRQVALTEVPCDANDLGPIAIGALALPVQRGVLQQRAGQARRVAVELVGPLQRR